MQKLYSLTRIVKGEGSNINSSITDLFFSSPEKAEAVLEWENKNLKTPYGLCECYYHFAVIEEASLDGNDPDWLFQIWYQMKIQANGDFLWTKIPCPEDYNRTVCFFGSGK